MENYANYSETPELDDDGFVMVKTRKELDEEKKTNTASTNASEEKVIAFSAAS